MKFVVDTCDPKSFPLEICSLKLLLVFLLIVLVNQKPSTLLSHIVLCSLYGVCWGCDILQLVPQLYNPRGEGAAMVLSDSKRFEALESGLVEVGQREDSLEGTVQRWYGCFSEDLSQVREKPYCIVHGPGKLILPKKINSASNLRRGIS